MKFVLILPYYITWHYSTAYIDLTRIWRNYLWFFWNFFSIPLLLKTLLSPWKRMNEDKPEFFSFQNLFERFIINSILRLVGLCVRIIFILAGVSIFIVIAIAGIFAYIIWTILPLILIGLVVYALTVFFI